MIVYPDKIVLCLSYKWMPSRHGRCFWCEFSFAMNCRTRHLDSLLPYLDWQKSLQSWAGGSRSLGTKREERWRISLRLFKKLKLVDDCPGLCIIKYSFQIEKLQECDHIAWRQEIHGSAFMTYSTLCADMTSLKGADYSVKSGAPPTEPCGTPRKVSYE